MSMDAVSRVDEFHPESAWQPTHGEIPMYTGPDLPSADVPEDLTGPEPTSIPVQVSLLPLIIGYEAVACYNDGSAPFIPPPPSTNEVLPMENFVTSDEKTTCDLHISESEARKVFSDLVSKRCCYGKSVIKDMVLQKMSSTNAYHYTLETYIETRMTSWEQEPYRGQLIDSPGHGLPPSPWDIHCHPNQMFHDEIHLMEVPHTAAVVPCTACACQGCLRCFNCLGRGFKRCISCHGSGNVMKLTDSRGPRHMDSCWRCRGTGRKRCPSCGGDGRVACKTCLGYKHLKCFINIRIEYSNNYCDHMINHSNLEEDVLKEVDGYQVFQQTQPRVWPIVNHPEEELCRTSDVMLSEHIKIFNSYARIIMQRQKLKMVPVTECTYTWKQEEIKFWIYGKEKILHAPNYPKKYCCGCVVV